MVFCTRGNKTSVYVRSPRKAPPSEREKQARQHFAEAVALAKQALKDGAERERFEELAKKEVKESTYSAAVSYYYKQVHERKN